MATDPMTGPRAAPAGREPERAERRRAALPVREVVELDAGRNRHHSRGRHAGGDHELADGLSARDHAIRQPPVHADSCRGGWEWTRAGCGARAGPSSRAAMPPSQPSTELCVCTTSICSRRISRTRPRSAATSQAPRMRCATTGSPSSRARGSSRPSGWAAMSTRQPRSAIQPASVRVRISCPPSPGEDSVCRTVFTRRRPARGPRRPPR